MTKGDDTRIRILDTALELFWKRSFHSVKTAEICKSAGVNKATLYRYFPSKLELAVQGVKQGRDRTLAYVFEGAFEKRSEPRLRLREIFERIYATHSLVRKNGEQCPGCPFVNLGVEVGTQYPEILKAVNASFGSFRPFYRQIVIALNSEPGRERLEPGATADSLLQIMNAGMVGSKLKNDPEEIRRARKIAERLLNI